MFDSIPFLKGRYLTYQGYFALQGVFICLGLWLLFFLLSKSYHLATLVNKFRKSNTKTVHDSRSSSRLSLQPVEYRELSPEAPDGIVVNPDASSSILAQRQYCGSSPKPIFTVFKWISFVMLSFVFLVLSSFDSLPIFLSILLTITFLSIMLLKDLVASYKSNYHIDDEDMTKTQLIKASILAKPRTSIVSFALIVLFSLFFGIGFSGSCIAFFNDSADFGIVKPGFSYNNYLIRSLAKKDSCPPGPPCHFFAMLAEDGSSTVLLHVHTHNDVQAIQVGVQTLIAGASQGVISDQQMYPIRNIEKGGQRNIHIALIDGLSPDSSYNISVSYNGAVQANYTYITLPTDTNTRAITIAAGGDVGANQLHQKMSSLIAKSSPDVIYVGGDLSYDNNIRHCYYIWDGFLKPLENIGHQIGRLVPMIFSVGNHDVGLNDYARRETVIDEDGPLYFSWFAQSTIMSGTNKSITPIKSRTPYQHHILGDTVLLSLDTGYVAKMEGAQSQFIANISMQYPNHRKIAGYHKPLFSPCTIKMRNNTENFIGKTAFVKMFDQYNFTLALENHSHTFKRTKPLKNNKVDPQGTVYIGEGCWAIKPSVCEASDENGFMEVMDNSLNHFWILNVQKGQVVARAYNQQGGVIDQTAI